LVWRITIRRIRIPEKIIIRRRVGLSRFNEFMLVEGEGGLLEGRE